MTQFIPGLELSRGFFFDEAKPILDKYYPKLVYSAGLLGYGSDVLGYDDAVSTDHMWGPRFYLFLSQKDFGKKEEIMDCFSRHLPWSYRGYSVHFGKEDEEGIRHMEEGEEKLSPLIFIETIEGYTKQYVGCDPWEALTNRQWLSFSEHTLLTFTHGELYVDGLGLEAVRQKLRFYPRAVKVYLVASQWYVIAEEQAFCRRCADRGDEAGSVLVAARIAERLMRLCFLYCDRYAPYSKWFGTAFAALPIPQEIKCEINRLLVSQDIDEREDHLVNAQVLVAKLHNSVGFGNSLEIRVQDYFGRNMKVLFVDQFAHQISGELKGTDLANAPLFGTMSQVANLTGLWGDVHRQSVFQQLYDL